MIERFKDFFKRKEKIIYETPTLEDVEDVLLEFTDKINSGEYIILDGIYDIVFCISWDRHKDKTPDFDSILSRLNRFGYKTRINKTPSLQHSLFGTIYDSNRLEVFMQRSYITLYTLIFIEKNPN